MELKYYPEIFGKAKELVFPLEKRDILEELEPGEPVLISGWLLCGRDATHRKILEEIKAGRFSFDFTNQAIYYVGPSPAPADKPIGAAGPTTASRMDAYTPELLEMGLAACIGKGKRSAKVKEALVKYKGVYLATFGGAGAFLASFIEKLEPIAWEDLGPEAFFRIKVKNFPAVVINTIDGRDFYEQVR
jgi:fumarate hydratase subunit beta